MTTAGCPTMRWLTASDARALLSEVVFYHLQSGSRGWETDTIKPHETVSSPSRKYGTGKANPIALLKCSSKDLEEGVYPKRQERTALSF